MRNLLKENNGITLIALVITIIVLLILAGVSIAMLTGENGILTQATEAKEENIKGKEKEQIKLAMQSLRIQKEKENLSLTVSPQELQEQLQYDGAKNVTVEAGKNDTLIVKYQESKNSYRVEQNGNIEENGTNGDEIEQPENVAKYWEVTKTTDTTWYSYNDVSNGDKKVKVNEPKLAGNMKPIKYIGPEADTQGGSKWANAMTTDGSMWVWIPRYAYKITEGYHTNVAGTIEVAFLDTNNKFLNGEPGEITTNPEEEGAGQTKWLVHPAFTSNAEAGGGFGEITGLWVGKFETTGTKTEISVKPGEVSLRNMTVNDFYKLGMNAKYGENVNLNSHMTKNSEWGATVYLAHSKYGINKQKIEINQSKEYYTGGTNVEEDIYTINKKQTSTYNATGIYDLNGGAWECVASYVNNGNASLGIKEEQATSTKNKTIYSSTNNQVEDYEIAKKNKGDGIYETSKTYSDATGSWFSSSAFFPVETYPYFIRGGSYSNSESSSFYFTYGSGIEYDYVSLRLSIVP